MSEFVTCESVASIVIHVRKLTTDHPKSLGGHAMPAPMSLCGMKMAWDCRSKTEAATCRDCIRELKSLRDVTSAV